MNRAGNGTRVTIVEDHALFAEALEVALTIEGYDVRRISVAPDQSSAAVLSAILKTQPRILLLDLDLGTGWDGLRLIDPITRTGRHVVVITGDGDQARWGECLRYGARAVLPKAAPLNQVIATVRRIHDGLPVMNRDERLQLLQRFSEERQAQRRDRSRLELLTRREQEVLALLMAGHPVRDIARISVVSVATVRTQVKSILAKLEVSSQLAAVGLAHRVGWLPPTRDEQTSSIYGMPRRETVT